MSDFVEGMLNPPEDVAAEYQRRRTAPCVSCGNPGEALHHRAGTKKVFNPSHYPARSWTLVLWEWLKCDPMCRPCHIAEHRGALGLVESSAI